MASPPPILVIYSTPYNYRYLVFLFNPIMCRFTINSQRKWKQAPVVTAQTRPHTGRTSSTKELQGN
ncbi:hypothetical protein GBAR_LOCUS1784, partial [Geodia barretti]